MEFNEELKNARLKLNMKQSEVAKALGVDTSTYCGYEIGKRSPDVARIKKLAEILEISADKLLGIEKENISENKKTSATLSTEDLLKNFIISLMTAHSNCELNEDDIAVITSVVKILDTWFARKLK